jgi:hypothetical protein
VLEGRMTFGAPRKARVAVASDRVPSE